MVLLDNTGGSGVRENLYVNAAKYQDDSVISSGAPGSNELKEYIRFSDLERVKSKSNRLKSVVKTGGYSNLDKDSKRKLYYDSERIEECYSYRYYDGRNASNIEIGSNLSILNCSVTPNKTTFQPGETFVVTLTQYPQGVEFNFELTNDQCSFEKLSKTSWRVSFNRPVTTKFKITGAACKIFTSSDEYKAVKITPVISLRHSTVPVFESQTVSISNTYGEYTSRIVNKTTSNGPLAKVFESLDNLSTYQVGPNNTLDDYVVVVSGDWLNETESSKFNFEDVRDGIITQYNSRFGLYNNVGKMKSKFWFGGLPDNKGFAFEYTPVYKDKDFSITDQVTIPIYKSSDFRRFKVNDGSSVSFWSGNLDYTDLTFSNCISLPLGGNDIKEYAFKLSKRYLILEETLSSDSSKQTIAISFNVEGKRELEAKGISQSDIVELEDKFTLYDPDTGMRKISIITCRTIPSLNSEGNVNYEYLMRGYVIFLNDDGLVMDQEDLTKAEERLTYGDTGVNINRLWTLDGEELISTYSHEPVTASSTTYYLSFGVTLMPMFGVRYRPKKDTIEVGNVVQSDIEILDLWNKTYDEVSPNSNNTKEVDYWKDPSSFGTISKHLLSPSPNGRTAQLALKSQWFQNWSRTYSSLNYYCYYPSYDELMAASVQTQNSDTAYTELNANGTGYTHKTRFLYNNKFPKAWYLQAPGGIFSSSWYSWVRVKVGTEEWILYYTDSQAPRTTDAIPLRAASYSSNGTPGLSYYIDSNKSGVVTRMRVGWTYAILGGRLSNFNWVMVAPDGSYTQGTDTINGETVDTFTFNRDGFFTLGILQPTYNTFKEFYIMVLP